jgi:prolyl-tRNA synthetase
MKYSKLFGKTRFDISQQIEQPSHRLLLKGGFIAESVAGRYYFLPLGWRVHKKIKSIIKQEMDAVDGQEMITPVLHPIELWEETNRTDSVGFELMSTEDRRGRAFALGGTAEEMFVDLVRKYNLSYKDLPFCLYQFSSKFRDEMRARGGLLRAREFVMKDAYSFHTDETDFKQYYQQIKQAYTQIFKRLGLETVVVPADNGYIGGDYCHEYQVVHAEGEGRFFVSQDQNYIAHEDIAQFYKQDKNLDEAAQPLKKVEAERGTTMKDGAECHQLPMWQQIKDVVYRDESGRYILAVIRGDLDVNEIKLAHAANAHQLTMASKEEVRADLNSEPGFISPVGLKERIKDGVELLIVGDDSLSTVRNAYGGANELHQDYLNINFDRDYQLDIEADIAMAHAGYLAPDGNSELKAKHGIEVGNIFQLGTHYSEKMQGAEFVDQDGSRLPLYMGCYGIGIGRTMATIVEKHHDEQGIIWPFSLAPFAVYLINLGQPQERAQQLYQQLQAAGHEVLWDDRDESPGVKFKDADLLGIPVRVVISNKTGDKVEYKLRQQDQTQLITSEQLLGKLAEL